MRQGPNPKRSRGRNNGRRPNMPLRMQTFDSNGPDVRIRGSAYQVHEKYLQLARDAASSGDRIMAESYLQHAEHYYRIMQANGGHDNQGQRPMTPADNEMAGGDEMDGHGRPQQAQGQPQQQPYQAMPPQQQQQPQPQHQHQHQPQPPLQPQPQPPHQQSATAPAGSGAQPPMPPIDTDYNA